VVQHRGDDSGRGDAYMDVGSRATHGAVAEVMFVNEYTVPRILKEAGY
jgi:hypothetical protein